MALVMAKPQLARRAPGRSVARRSLQGWAVQEPTPEARPPRRIRDIYGGAGVANKTRLMTGPATPP
jgi:hypothetical protein